MNEMKGSVRASLGLVKDDRLLLLEEGIACATSTRLLRAAKAGQESGRNQCLTGIKA
jgi:hypothetical protein